MMGQPCPPLGLTCMPLTVQFLGSGDAFGSGGRLQACVSLTDEHGRQVLLACGAFPLEFVELAPRAPAQVGPVSVVGFPVTHASGAPAYALRVSAGEAVVAYSGDTEWTRALLEAARDADLFICEAYQWQKRVRYH